MRYLCGPTELVMFPIFWGRLYDFELFPFHDIRVPSRCQDRSGSGSFVMAARGLRIRFPCCSICVYFGAVMKSCWMGHNSSPLEFQASLENHRHLGYVCVKSTKMSMFISNTGVSPCPRPKPRKPH